MMVNDINLYQFDWQDQLKYTPDGCGIGFADGSVRWARSMTPEDFEAMVTRAGRESFLSPNDWDNR